MKKPLIYYTYTIRSINVDGAIKKLNRAKIEVFSLKKVDKTTITFCSKEYKKVLLIFNGSCYNVDIVDVSRTLRAFRKILEKPFFIIGCAMMLFLSVFANYLVLKIDIIGTGSYYKSEVVNILSKYGIDEFSVYKENQIGNIQSELLSLPCVNFCSIEKQGSILKIELQASTPEIIHSKVGENLVSKYGGKVKSIVVVSGTAKVKIDDNVVAGQTLIEAEKVINIEGNATTRKVIAIGKVELECVHQYTFEATEENEDMLEKAYGVGLIELEENEILNKSFTVINKGENVIYEVIITYMAIESINMY